ncbi:hypothetical protein BDR06DRAFT_983417 [Suillus hirtellus]|nr:hypothetical protein BDR06DRAFT_983417 [Suillus hirtellus]
MASSSDPFTTRPPWPWKSMSVWRLMSWLVTGSDWKSMAETKHLVNEVLRAEDFNLKDFENFNPDAQMKHFDASKDHMDIPGIFQQDGWKETDVKIMVPSKEKNLKGNGCMFLVSGLLYRPLIAVIKAAFSEQLSKRFHLTPFKHIWKSPVTGREQQLYGELYTSDAWIQAHNELQKQRREDSCKLERVIAGLMFWSDSTHLTQFGNASAWPVYLFFGNLSKYVCSDPNSGACHPVAFIPTLLDAITCFISSFLQRKNYCDILTHCKQELFHAVWSILLNNEFIHAYKDGIVVKCHDGVYQPDYPEKVLLATIRDKGNCPCPHFSKACNAIYTHGVLIKGTLVESLLKEFSLNSFIDHLSPLGLDFFPIIIVNLLHKFELGVLKGVMMHLMQLLYAIDPWKIDIINERFHSIPSFGQGQRVARHFEDMLQCTIPTFEGLFPGEHDSIIRVLLFRMAEWHALAKMHLHSDDTIHLLDQFHACTCSAFQTTELPSKMAAHYRRQHDFESQSRPKVAEWTGPHPKSFNLFTYKLHALRDYVHSIRLFGTTNSYTTQIVGALFNDGEVAHCLIKKFYRMTNKQDIPMQLAKHERRHTRFRWQQQSVEIEDPIANVLELHHHLSDSWVNVINLAAYLVDHSCDPTIKDFIPKLKNHLLSCILELEYDGDECIFSDSDRNDLHFTDNLSRVQQPHHFRVNYTTYDIPGYNCNVMALSREEHEGAHPFCLEVLLVRWLGVDPTYHWGLKEARLPKVGFIPETDNDAFGFLDPSLVIHDGHSNALLRHSPSLARGQGEIAATTPQPILTLHSFADQDMFARFVGIGIGHEIQYDSLTDELFSCEDELDHDGEAASEVLEDDEHELRVDEDDDKDDYDEHEDEEDNVESTNSDSSSMDADEDEESDSVLESGEDQDDECYIF